MFEKFLEHLGYGGPKWAMRSARAWFPACANQPRWSEEEERRRLGHWAPGSQTMDTYDRALCTTELRLRNSIFEKITVEGWFPTQSSEVRNKSIKDNTSATKTPPISQPLLKIENNDPSEGGGGSEKATPAESEGQPNGESPTSSVSWHNVSV